MQMKAATTLTDGFCGSPICMAPEVATRTAAYGPQCDIWSVGCITYELLSGYPPFNAATAPELFRIIQMVSGPSFNDWIWLQITSDAKDLVVSMLQRRPEDRVSAREALHHNWFRTAPDTHNAEAHDNIIRRITREDSFATTVTLLPGSRAPSRSVVRVTTARTALSASSHGMKSDTMQHSSEEELESATRHSSSDHSVHTQHSPTKAPSEADEAHCHRSARKCNHLTVPRLPVQDRCGKDDVEGKVFWITRGGLQQAAWSGDREVR